MLEFLLPVGLLDGEPPSWYALVRPDDLRPAPYDGVPRAARSGAEPRILVLEAGGAADAFVAEYAADLGYISDAWFPTREAAVSDAVARFGDSLGPWLPVPAAEDPPEHFVLSAVSAPPA